MGTIHLICGMAGAGKTTLARQLERDLDAIRLCPDEWIEPLLESKSDRPEMDRLRPRVQQLQWDLALRLVPKCEHVIWEPGLWHSAERYRCVEQAREAGAAVVLHYFDLSVEEIKRRVVRRNANLPKGSFRVEPDEIDRWMTWFERPDEVELAIYSDVRIYGE